MGGRRRQLSWLWTGRRVRVTGGLMPTRIAAHRYRHAGFGWPAAGGRRRASKLFGDTTAGALVRHSDESVGHTFTRETAVIAGYRDWPPLTFSALVWRVLPSIPG